MSIKIYLIALLCLCAVINVESRPNNHRKFITHDPNESEIDIPNPRRMSSGRRRPNRPHRRLTCLANVTHKFVPLKVPEGKQLELVHLVFRHGVRTPADTYPNDPYVNNTFEPYGWGHLTNTGKCRIFDTGKWLRARYNTYLGDLYFPDLVHAQATGVARTQMSMAVMLAGLFRPRGNEMEWNKALDWQPIPIVSQELDKDTLLLVRINCPRYYEALHEVYMEPKIENYFNIHKDLYDNLTKITGLPINNPDDVSSLWSTLRAEEIFGLELPKWTKHYYPYNMQDNTDYSFILNVYTDEMKRIKGGPLLKKISNEWLQKSENNLSPKERKIYMYAGHDSTIVNLLSALNLWTKQIPDYDIMAMFELYKDIKTGEYDVKIYQKNAGQEPIPLQLPGCDVSCPLKKVLEIVKPMLPTDTLASECTPHDPNATTPKPSGP